VARVVIKFKHCLNNFFGKGTKMRLLTLAMTLVGICASALVLPAQQAQSRVISYNTFYSCADGRISHKIYAEVTIRVRVTSKPPTHTLMPDPIWEPDPIWKPDPLLSFFDMLLDPVLLLSDNNTNWYPPNGIFGAREMVAWPI